MTTNHTRQSIYCGVDTHADTHHAALLTDTGVLLKSSQFPTTTTGYQELTEWMNKHGEPIAVGIEGTASYGAGLTRHLRGRDVAVVEVPRPNRKLRRSKGKSDPIDAEAAARAVLARNQLSQPKHGAGPIEGIRALRVARSGAIKAATASMNAIRSMIITAPESLRTHLRGHSTAARSATSFFRPLISACSSLLAPARSPASTWALRHHLRSVLRPPAAWLRPDGSGSRKGWCAAL